VKTGEKPIVGRVSTRYSRSCFALGRLPSIQLPAVDGHSSTLRGLLSPSPTNSTPPIYLSGLRLERYRMISEDGDGGSGPVPSCPDCRSALQSGGREAVSFLLVDSLTVPVVGCEVHLEQFRLICGRSTEDTAKLLSHRPAGGVVCPGCRRATRSREHPIVRIGHGAAAVLGCDAHEEDVLDRYKAGLDARRR